MLSYWERKHFLHHDLVVVGAGIVGLSTAIQFKRMKPESKVLVLERGIFPSGASTKNAGFACFGSLTEILDDLDTMSEQEVFQLVIKRYQGLLAIRKEFGDEGLGYRESGGYELFTSKELEKLAQLDAVNRLLFPLFGNSVFDEIRSVERFGFGKEVVAVVRNSFEGELDTGRFISALWDRCQSLGVKILTGSKVETIDLEKHLLTLTDWEDSKTFSFEADKIALCTNAFTQQLLPDLDIIPGRGIVMLSKPIVGGIPWEGSFHYDKGYVYFRNIDGCLLMGGGRNLDFQGERTTQTGINPKIKAYLLDLVRDVVLPGRSTEIDMEWSGVMAFGQNKKPIIQPLGPNVAIAVRLGGMGVAIGWHVAGELVALLNPS